MRSRLVWLALAGSIASAQSLTLAQQQAVIEAVRSYALNYTQNLPNYTCTELIHRYLRPSNSRLVPQSDTVEAQVSLVDRREIQRVLKVNNKPAAKDQRPPGAFSRGEFANILDNIFEPETAAEIHWQKTATIDHQKVNVLSFVVPRKTGYGLEDDTHTVLVPYRGSVYANAQTNAVVRIEMRCFDIPEDTIYQAVGLTLEYKPAEVAGQTYILPAHYELRFSTNAGQATNQADYKDYRKFSAEATIIYQDSQ